MANCRHSNNMVDILTVNAAATQYGHFVSLLSEHIFKI